METQGAMIYSKCSHPNIYVLSSDLVCLCFRNAKNTHLSNLKELQVNIDFSSFFEVSSRAGV